MKYIMVMVVCGVIILITVSLVVVVYQADRNNAYEINKQVCTEAGGVPIRSVWDGRELADCKFPPQLGTEKE